MKKRKSILKKLLKRIVAILIKAYDKDFTVIYNKKNMKIVHYKPEFRKYFEQLNKAWLTKYFTIEPLDEELLSNPEDNILNKDGKILFVEHNGKIIGTVALIYVKEGVYELAKMAVNENFHGVGAGKFLCRSAIQEAKKLNAEKLILFTNSKLKTAIKIYQNLGFKNIPLRESQFSRADLKMELYLTTQRWFDRKFDFNFGIEVFENLLDRLQKTSKELHQITQNTNNNTLIFNTENKWSIKEHIGHLILLESLWQTRLIEIKKETKEMSPTDLSNSATDGMNFNADSLSELLNTFSDTRKKTIDFLNTLQKSDYIKTSIHPRLQQPMRMIDMMYFIAEHDQHHLEALLTIINT